MAGCACGQRSNTAQPVPPLMGMEEAGVVGSAMVGQIPYCTSPLLSSVIACCPPPYNRSAAGSHLTDFFGRTVS